VVPLALALIFRFYVGAAAIAACLATSLVAHSRPFRHHVWYHYLDYGAVTFWCAWLLWLVAARCGARVWAMLVAAAAVLAVLRVLVDREPYLTQRRKIIHVGVHLVAVATTVAIIICGRHSSTAGMTAWTKS
jgi:hypothetical protein